MSKALCQHCRLRYPNRPRGLCSRCDRLPGVRERYTTTNRYNRRGVGLTNRTALPTEATNCPPGTLCKVIVMARRALAGVSVFHPGDAQQEESET